LTACEARKLARQISLYVDSSNKTSNRLFESLQIELVKEYQLENAQLPVERRHKGFQLQRATFVVLRVRHQTIPTKLLN